MALPSRGDPLRSVHLAVRVMRFIGAFLILCALIGLYIITLGSSAKTMSAADRSYYLRVLLAYGLPGVAYLLLAQFLIRRQIWAAIVALLLTVAALAAAVALIVTVLRGIAASQGTWELTMFIPIGVIELFLAALAWLLFLLARSIAAIRRLKAPARVASDVQT